VSDVVDTLIQGVSDDMNRLRGRMFGLIETAGLPDKQEAAFKSLVRGLTYDALADVERTLKEQLRAEHQ
jgi:hypothetical protein